MERARPEPSRTTTSRCSFASRRSTRSTSRSRTTWLLRPAPRSRTSCSEDLAETGWIGIGRFVLRPPHLVALRPLDRALMVETLFFGDEVRDAGSLVARVGDASINERELEISKLLVDALAADWDPSMFSDEYREELLRMIAERTPAHVEHEDEPEAHEGRIGELLDALRRSVEEAKAREAGGGRQVG